MRIVHVSLAEALTKGPPPAISPFRFFRTVRSWLSYTPLSATTRRSPIGETRFTSLPVERACSLMASSATPSSLVRFCSFPRVTRIALRTFHLTSLSGSLSTDRREANRVFRARAKTISDFETHSPSPRPLPSDGRRRIVPRATADPTALETANDGSGCSLSRRTGQGEFPSPFPV